MEALRERGLDVDSLTREDLASFDEFHGGGAGGTEYLAKIAKLSEFPPTSLALDVGSGIGGPARTLAANFGFVVTGMEPNNEYLTSAKELTKRLGMETAISFVPGDATALPFEDDSFDLVWSQNVLMNVSDKATAFKEMHRVLRPGGTAAVQCVVEGPESGVHYPVGWAEVEATSFLVPSEELRSLIVATGLTETVWIVGPPPVPTRLAPEATASLNYGLIMNQSWTRVLENVNKNVGKTDTAWGVFKKE